MCIVYCVVRIAYLVLFSFESTLNIVFLSKSTLKLCVFLWKGETLAFVQLLHIPLVLTSTDNSETFAMLVWAHIHICKQKVIQEHKLERILIGLIFKTKKQKVIWQHKLQNSDAVHIVYFVKYIFPRN